MARSKEIVFEPEGKRVEAQPESTILESAKRAGVDLTSVCGGEGTCGKCKVVISKYESVAPVTDVEKAILTSQELAKGYRLACRTKIEDALVVRIPDESRTGKQRLQVEGIDTAVKPDALFRKYFMKLPVPTLKDLRSDSDRLVAELQKYSGLRDIHVNYEVLRTLPSILREAAWEITATTFDDRSVADVESGNTTDRLFGYAVDIGTTKLAGYLLNLESGRVEAAGSLMNPQVAYGEDVITRIAYENQNELQRVVVDGINQILGELCSKVGVEHDEVFETVVVGNTAMHHLFLNIHAKYLALSPYTPAIREGMDVAPARLGVKINPRGNVHALPVVAGFVGADNVAVILATEIWKRDELCMALDIGTNTEVVLGNKERMVACSCASGPAFEGAHIKHGMRAASGAIEKVIISPIDLHVSYETIDDTKPCGICGSAIIDIPVEMLKTGIINVNGTISRDSHSRRVRENEGVMEFVIAWKDETSIDADIVITQKDIREVQLAKAAIHTGAATLLRNTKLTEHDIEIAFIAGAFGSYVDPDNARMLGMYPEIALEKIRVVGNAAGTGARMALISKTGRKDAEIISRRIEYVELANDPNFQNEIMNSTFLPYADLSRYPETSELLKKLGHFPERLPPIMR